MQGHTARGRSDVEQEWRSGCEKQKEDARKPADTYVQPSRRESDAREERDHGSDSQRYLRLAYQCGRQPSEEAEELVIVREPRPHQDRVRPASHELFHRDDLVEPAPEPEPDEACPAEDRREQGICRQMSASPRRKRRRPLTVASPR
jgi:hypothetical protein